MTDPTLVENGHMDAGLIIEKALRNRKPSLPITILCPHNNRVWAKVGEEKGAELLRSLMRTHSYAVFPGIILRLN